MAAVSILEPGAQSEQIIKALMQGPLSMNELVDVLQLKSKTGSLKRAISELLSENTIGHTIPDKPNSRLQKYRLIERQF